MESQHNVGSDRALSLRSSALMMHRKSLQSTNLPRDTTQRFDERRQSVSSSVCCTYEPQTGSIINLKIGNCYKKKKKKPLLGKFILAVFKTHTSCLTSRVHWVFPLINSGRGNTATKEVFFVLSPFFYWQITLLFLLLKVALVHFDAIWLCFYTMLWFLHFLTTFFRPCQKAILRVHVWKDMDCSVTQGFFFFFIGVGPLPGDISQSPALLCNAPFLCFFGSHLLTVVWL